MARLKAKTPDEAIAGEVPKNMPLPEDRAKLLEELLENEPIYECSKHGVHDMVWFLNVPQERFRGPWCCVCIVEKLFHMGMRKMHKMN